MVEIKNVTKRFGDFTAIEDLSFTVSDSSVYGLVGYNGAGKTTLLKTVAGVYRPDGGEVIAFGESTYDNPKIKQRMFYVPDELYFFPRATMEKMASFYKMFFPAFSTKVFRNMAEAFALKTDSRLTSFSKGMQRQAEMCFAMAARPDILLLDEIFDGLDPAKRSMTEKIVLEYMSQSGCSVIVSSHNLHDLAGICDHLGLINGKRIVLDCSVDEMSASRRKYRVIFDRDVGREDFGGIKIRRFEKDGKIITLTVDKNQEETEEKIMAMKPLLVEKFALTLEEIFLEEMEESDYDISKIFA